MQSKRAHCLRRSLNSLTSSTTTTALEIDTCAYVGANCFPDLTGAVVVFVICHVKHLVGFMKQMICRVSVPSR